MATYQRRTVITGAASIPTGTFAAPMTRTAVKTANYTANLWEIVPADTTGGTFALTLPAASGGKGRVAFKWVTGSTAPTIAFTGSDHLNTTSGPTTGTFSLANQGFVFESDGSSVWTVTADDLPLTALDSRYINAVGIVRPPFVVTSSNVTVGVANVTRYFRAVEGGTISKLRLTVGTASGNIAVAVYRNSGSGLTSVPGTRAATSGSVACPSAGVQDVSLGGSVTVNAGDWLAIGADNTTATFAGTTGLGDTPLSTGFCGLTSDYPPAATAGAFTAQNNRIITVIGVP
jgi:hypothetical protein